MIQEVYDSTRKEGSRIGSLISKGLALAPRAWDENLLTVRALVEFKHFGNVSVSS